MWWLVFLVMEIWGAVVLSAMIVITAFRLFMSLGWIGQNEE